MIMKQVHSNKLSFIVFAALLSSCLGTSDPPREPNIFSLTITIPNAGEDYILGNDTITVISYKMLIDSIRVIKGNQEERFEPRLRLATYVIGLTDSYTIGSGVVRGGNFTGVGYSVVRPPLDGSFDDPDLIERDSRGLIIDSYSLSLNGVYKRQFFRFRSRIERAVEYGFSNNVQLTDVNAYLEARLRGNWKQWFLNANGNAILDPNNSSNRAQIENNVLKYFDIFTIAFGEVTQ
jgi:hypothetical protein